MTKAKAQEPTGQTPPDQVAIGQTPPDAVAVGQTPPNQIATTATPLDDRPYTVDDWAGHENFHCHVPGCRYDGFLGREEFEAHWQADHTEPDEPEYSKTLTDELGRYIRLN